MKCLLVANIFPPINGGSAVVYESLCQFAPAGTMHVLAPWRHYLSGEEVTGWREYDAQAGFPIERIELLRPPAVSPKSLLHSAWLQLWVDLPLKLKVLRKAVSMIRREGIDVVCVCELSSGSWLGLLLKRMLGIPYINYIHGEEITTEVPYRLFGRRRRQYLHNADAVVAVSEFTRRTLIDKMGVAPERIELIVNGVDAERFQPGPKSQDLLERYGLAGKRVLLTVGRLVERKGIDTTIRALPQVLAQCPDARYLIVGTGDYRTELEALVAEYGVGEQVIFAGRVPHDELVAHYQLCDLFVMPNRELANHDTEGFGLVFLEANACGKAVVAGRAGGVVEAVRHGETGLNVDGEDVGAVAGAITGLLLDDTRREAMGARGLEVARQSSSAARAQLFRQLCERVAGG
ncbi:glycosyltransferase family 4 protein [uncultured Thiohalocapsa sp.]|uniref:glycosyltransferase family 4 protein n=1 Tax=uncultured Thiohalocapsa sp. TaxID=768990 RepID=UPI0025F0F647|nr:glycosyltransferase family 4 protein [uncultured Thiohalocapsa sp.]